MVSQLGDTKTYLIKQNPIVKTFKSIFGTRPSQALANTKKKYQNIIILPLDININIVTRIPNNNTTRPTQERLQQYFIWGRGQKH